jgi:SAM-dependent methyltransferase
MFDNVSVKQANAIDDVTARQLLAAFDLSNDPVSLLRIRSLMRKEVRFGNSLIQVESQQFLHRVRSSGHEVGTEPECDNGRPSVRNLTAIPAYRWTKSYMPRRLKAGHTILANMRLENCGLVPLHCSGEGRVTVAIRWQHRDGSVAEAPDERTPLPIDLQPGQALTVAVRVIPPSRPGSYRLSLTLVQEQVRWLNAGAHTMAVSVLSEVPEPVPAGWVVLPKAPASYDADHDEGCAMLVNWLQHHAPARPRVLEVGGNAAPMLSRLGTGFGSNLVNLDVDLLGLQVGRMVTRERGTPLHHICADAFNLPFASGYFDAIVIFASLHHFADPAALLASLRLKLRPGGFIGLFCEPVGHVWPGAVTPAFLEELERGINEQSFSLQEYALMFRQAELTPAEVLVDLNSLKARLTHTPLDETP